MKKIFLSLIILFYFSFFAVTKYYKLVEFIPDTAKVKKDKNYSTKEKTIIYQSNLVRIEVEPFLLKNIKEYYNSKGMENPFEEISEGFNYIFFRVKIENLSKEQNLDFSPSMVILNDMVFKDDGAILEMFYDKANSEKKLELLGKTMFFKPLSLPPKMWIERLLFFEYDDVVPRKKFLLTFSCLTLHKEIFEVSFPFKAKFVKEKSDGSNS